MSDTSPILSLPYIQPSQAQKHVTHNEAIRILDLLVQLVVADADRTEAPATPATGDRHIVALGASGSWAGRDGQIAVWDTTGWLFYEPLSGWRADVLTTGSALRFDGAAWADTGPDFQNLDLLGVATTADSDNRLAVASTATLLSHAGAGHQLKINKAASPDTASLLFQTGFSGRAEMGTAGDDSFSIKTSADGSTWNDALRIDGSGNIGVGRSPDAKLDVDGVMRLSPMPKADLPAAGDVGIGGLVFVSDAAGGAQLAYSDGSAWLKVRDGAPV